MFYDGMVFILYTKKEAKALGKMLSAEGIRWVDGTDPAKNTYFTAILYSGFSKGVMQGRSYA